MKRIKQIFQAYIITRRSPSQSIRRAWGIIKQTAPKDHATTIALGDIGDLIVNLIAEAEGMEKSANTNDSGFET